MGARRRPPAPSQEVFVSPETPPRPAATNADATEQEGTRDASRTRQPEEDAGREVHALPPPAAPPSGPRVAQPPDRARPDLVLGGPARRQPGPHRPDGPGPQAADVQGPRRHGLQGDRGRVPVRVAAGLRLHPPADRRGPDPRRRHDPGPDPVPPRADRADVRVPAGREAGDRPLLQLHLGPAAARRLPPGQGRRDEDRRRRRAASAWSRRPGCPAPRSATSTRPRASPAPSSTTRSRSAPRSWT